MTYKLSFTSISLAPKESLEIAQVFLEVGNWQEVDEVVKQKKIISRTKTASVIRISREIRQRLQNLTRLQLELLNELDSDQQRKLVFLAVCKTYPFIAQFVVEVVRRKYLLYDYHILDSDYSRFYREKADLHQELNDLAESTQKKIRQVLFLILSEAGIISNPEEKLIQPQFLDEPLKRVLEPDNPVWLKCFLLPDSEITNE